MSEPTSRAHDIYHLFNHGLSIPEIMVRLRLPRSTVASAIQRGRKSGAVPPVKRRGDALRAQGLRHGSIGWAYENLSDRQKVWLVDHLTRNEYGSVVEYVLELIRDAYEECK